MADENKPRSFQIHQTLEMIVVHQNDLQSVLDYVTDHSCFVVLEPWDSDWAVYFKPEGHVQRLKERVHPK